jgi:serine protease Do
MNTRKMITAMIFSSILGGVIAIGGYTLIQPDQQLLQPREVRQEGAPSFTNMVLDTSNFIVPEGLNFVYAANNSKDAVVHIRTVYNGTRGEEAIRFEDLFREYFDQQPNNPHNNMPSQGAGSGVIVSGDGYIVTNNHVVDGATEIEVLLNDNRTYEAEVVGLDPTTDLAVLKIEERNLPSMRWGDSDKLQLGEWVLAVGNPFQFRSTVTAGIVSAKARNIGILARQNRETNLQIESFIQTDAAVNPGNSGGALVNLRGELVGINTAIISPTGAFAGYSFAVPVSLVHKVYEDLVAYGQVQRAMLGIRIRDVNSDLNDEEDLGTLRGVYIQSVIDGSTADDANLESGDVILEINGQPVNNVSQLQEKIALKRPGEEVEVTYLRNGNKRVVGVTLKNQNGNTDLVAAVTDEFTLSGATFTELTENELMQFDIDGGVKVTDIGGGKWKEAGIKRGFIVTRVDKTEINDVKQFSDYLNQVKGEGILIEGIYPDGEKAYYGIGW